jgi:hypothetical protein
MEQNGYDKAKYLAKYPELASVKQTMTNEELYANNKVTKNILYHVGGVAHNSLDSRQFLEGLGNVADNNIYWSDKTYNILNSYKFVSYSFAQWQALGKDVNSVFADPKFTSVSGEDFSFQTGSPALSKSIAAINVALTGPQVNTITNPVVTIINPMPNDSVSGTGVFSAVVADITPISSVIFSIDSQEVAKFSAQQSYTKNIDTTTLSDGLHRFKVVAVNIQGGVGVSEVDFTTSNTEDLQKPVVSLIAPTDGYRLKRTTKVEATATDNKAVVKVEFYVDGVIIRSFATGPYTFGWDTRGAEPGNHKLYVKAYDAAGNVATSPAITVIAPSSSGKGAGNKKPF